MRYRLLALFAWCLMARPAPAQWPFLVKDIRPGNFGSSASNLRSVNGVLFFAANDGVTGTELWKSDGTEPGTVLVKDIAPGSGSSFPANLTNVNGTLFFVASDGVTGRELWKSDGTPAGTVLVADVEPGPTSSNPSDLAAIGTRLFFDATQLAIGSEPWVSDGTAGGTASLVDICPGACSSSPGDPALFGGLLYFGSSHNSSLWSTDGTPAGTMQVKSISAATAAPRHLTVSGANLFFQAFDSPTGFELWKSDGTTAGTVLVKDIYPGGGHSSPVELAEVNGTLFFQATDGVSGGELWKSDGSAAGTVLVKDVRPGSSGSFPKRLEALKDRLFFVAEDGVHGEELWESDGSGAGTLLKDLAPGATSSFPQHLLALNDTLFFAATARFGGEVYKTARGLAGYQFVDDVFRGSIGSSPGGLTRAGPFIFFTANDGTNGNELWAVRIDGLHYFTVTSLDAENRLEWINPVEGNLQIRFRTDGFPANATDGTLLANATGQGDAHESLSHAPVANGTTYFYRAFVDDGASVVSDRTAKGRPDSMAGPTRWIYNTGATATEAPGLAPVMALSNDRILHSMVPGPTGGTWPTGWRPFASKSMAQGRPPVAPVSLGPASRVVLFSANDGLVHAVDGTTGEYLWRSVDLGMLQAIPAAMFTAFGGAFDLVLVGTREAGGNTFRGLALATGNVAWTFNNAGVGIGPISSQAAVDYATNRVYFGSRADGAGSDRTVWCLSFNSVSGNLVWARGLGDPTPVGEMDGSPILRAGKLYAGTNESRVHALDAVTGADRWIVPVALNDGPVKAFVWAPRDGNELYLSTTNTVWALADNGNDASELWRTTAIPMPSVPARIGRFLYVGGDDGRLYEIDLTIGPGSLKWIQLGDGLSRLGAPSFDLLRSMVYVGSESGAIYGVLAPLP